MDPEISQMQSPVYNTRDLSPSTKMLRLLKSLRVNTGAGHSRLCKFDQFVDRRRVFAGLRLDATSKILVEIVDIVE